MEGLGFIGAAIVPFRIFVESDMQGAYRIMGFSNWSYK